MAADGIDKTNTLFVFTADEGDHYVGGTPNPVDCDGVTTPCDWSGQGGEVNANIDTLITYQFPTLAGKFLGTGAPNTFTVHGDDAPPFYLAKVGAGPLSQTDADTRLFERTVASLTALNPYTGATDKLMVQMADQTGMKALHMFTTGDPARNATFAFFADANYFLTDCALSTTLGANQPTLEALGDAYKQSNAPFGAFATSALVAALVGSIRAALDGAAFGGQPVDSSQAQTWVSHAQSLLADAAALAAP